MPFGKLQAGCHVRFTEEWLLSGHSTIKVQNAAEMLVLLEGSPISTEELWSSVRVRAVEVMTFCQSVIVKQITAGLTAIYC